MLENQGEYICASPAESYRTKPLRPHPSVYRCHCCSAGSEPYTTTNALFRSPNSLFTTNPAFSSSSESVSPMDFLVGSSLRITNVSSTGLPSIVHTPS